MSIFKNLIGTILTAFSLVSGEDDGWFPVEKIPKAEEAQMEEDPTIWVLFSKTIDSEKILVRFPADPVYSYTETGDLAIRSEKDGEIFELTVYKKNSQAPFSSDLQYQSEGKWVREQFVATEQHVYRFQTHGLQSGSINHERFVSSFSINS